MPEEIVTKNLLKSIMWRSESSHMSQSMLLIYATVSHVEAGKGQAPRCPRTSGYFLHQIVNRGTIDDGSWADANYIRSALCP